MNREEFSLMLSNQRKSSGCPMKKICFALNVMPTTIYRMEGGKNSYNMSLPIKYLQSLGAYMSFKINSKKYAIKEYADIIKCISIARENAFSQQGLASYLGISRTYLANVESLNTIIGVDIFLRIASALKITIEINNEH